MSNRKGWLVHYWIFQTKLDLILALQLEYSPYTLRSLLNSWKKPWNASLVFFKEDQDFWFFQTKRGKFKLEFFCISYFPCERASRKSRPGWVALSNGSTVSWASQKQAWVASSASEAGYIALSGCCKEIKWMCILLAEIRIVVDIPTNLFSNNIAAQSWSNQMVRRAKLSIWI